MINAREKGKKGEREFAAFLREHGYSARRGVQYQGTENSPDVTCPELPFHWEVKFGRLNLREAYAQAKEESGPRLPVIAHRATRRGYQSEWMIIMSAEDFLSLIKHGDAT